MAEVMTEVMTEEQGNETTEAAVEPGGSALGGRLGAAKGLIVMVGALGILASIFFLRMCSSSDGGGADSSFSPLPGSSQGDPSAISELRARRKNRALAVSR